MNETCREFSMEILVEIHALQLLNSESDFTGS